MLATLVGCNLTAIAKLRHRFQQTNSANDRQQSGRPKATTRRQDRLIELHSLRNTFTATTQTAAAIQASKALKHRFRQVGLKARRPYVRQILTVRHRA